MSEELKPCPFCGGKADIVIITSDKGDKYDYDQIICHCGAINGDPYDCDMPTFEQWQTRPIEDALRAELEAERQKTRWIPVGEKLPEVNEFGYSEYVQLAYAVYGCKYLGSQVVSRYHLNHKTQTMEWEYMHETLSSWGYEPVAWRCLPEPPEGAR